MNLQGLTYSKRAELKEAHEETSKLVAAVEQLPIGTIPPLADYDSASITLEKETIVITNTSPPHVKD